MSLVSRFRRRAPGNREHDVLEVDLAAATYELDGQDRQQLRGQGLKFRDRTFGTTIRDDDPRLRDAGIYVTTVAGVRRRLRELQCDRFAPIQIVTLRREPDNPYDPDAVAVFDRKGRTAIGYVPFSDAPAIAALLDSGTKLEARCFWEWRSGDGLRRAIGIVIAPKGLTDLGWQQHRGACWLWVDVYRISLRSRPRLRRRRSRAGQAAAA
jgi:hypothetical protein